MRITDDSIVKEPNDVLRAKASEVSFPLSEEDKQTIEDMIEYVRASHSDELCEQYNIRPSVGIAAPQIGISKKIVVISIPYDDQKDVEYALVNPKLIANSTQKACLEGGESCLSVVPDVEGYVPRYNKITVRAYNYLTGKVEEIKATGYHAIVIQHEMDHLKGLLYHDHINKQNPWQEIANIVKI